MLIPESTEKDIEALIKREFSRVNRTDDGWPMTLSQMEALVSDVGNRLQQSLLRAIMSR